MSRALELAKECGAETGATSGATFTGEELEAFYHAARAEMAREASGNLSYLGWTTRFMGVRFEPDALDRFATLIANETLERAAKVCDDLWQEEANAAANGTQEPKYHDCIECSYAIRALKE